jgi:hypothetical protein
MPQLSGLEWRDLSFLFGRCYLNGEGSFVLIG